MCVHNSGDGSSCRLHVKHVHSTACCAVSLHAAYCTLHASCRTVCSMLRNVCYMMYTVLCCMLYDVHCTMCCTVCYMLHAAALYAVLCCMLCAPSVGCTVGCNSGVRAGCHLYVGHAPQPYGSACRRATGCSVRGRAYSDVLVVHAVADAGENPI